jgi:hypothetical protein
VSPEESLNIIFITRTIQHIKFIFKVSIENHEEVFKLTNQFNAILLFAGMKLKCVSTEKNNIPDYGAGYETEFSGFNAF